MTVSISAGAGSLGGPSWSHRGLRDGVGEGVGLGVGEGASADAAGEEEDWPAAVSCAVEQEARAAAVPAASMSMKSRRCIRSILKSSVYG